VKPYHELPDAKLKGRYSTPLLLHLWCQWIKANVKVTTAEVKVLAPIAYGISELNLGIKAPNTGFRNNGVVTPNLRNRVNNLSVMVPKEWTFSHFERLVTRNLINCDELEPFKSHMGKPLQVTGKRKESTSSKAGKSESSDPKGNRSRTPPSKLSAFARTMARSFVFEDQEASGTEEQAAKLPPLPPEMASQSFQKYLEAGVIKKVQFDQEKLLKFHEEEANRPENCGGGIALVWDQHQKLVEAKKVSASANRKGKRKTIESPVSTRSSERIQNKKPSKCFGAVEVRSLRSD
jgi:hypothetical protein